MKKIILGILLALIVNTTMIRPVYAQIGCMSYAEAIGSRSWEDRGDIDNGGKKVYLNDDSDLPPGYEAIGDGATITIDNPDRFMGAGAWSIYKVCSGEAPTPDDSCPTMDELISSHGLQGIEQIDDSGVRIQNFLEDSLPWGYVGISEHSYISADDSDRFMPMGVWSIYRTCGE